MARLQLSDSYSVCLDGIGRWLMRNAPLEVSKEVAKVGLDLVQELLQ